MSALQTKSDCQFRSRSSKLRLNYTLTKEKQRDASASRNRMLQTASGFPVLIVNLQRRLTTKMRRGVRASTF